MPALRSAPFHRFLALVLLATGLVASAQALAKDMKSFAAQNTNGPVQVIADEVIYNPEEQTVIAKGHVQLAQGKRVLLADAVTYNEKTRLVAASGNVSLIEPTGNVVHADYVELDDQFRRGFLKSVGVLFSDHSRAAAAQGERKNDNLTTLDKAVYSPCPVCASDPKAAPLWQVKATRIVHDKKAKTITYEDATFEIFGVPVAYMPYFEHPDPSVKRQSGFLAPKMGGSGRLGSWYAQPYFWAIDNQTNLTFTPTITTKAGPYGIIDFHQQTKTGGLNLQTSFGYGTDYKDDGTKTDDEIRGHIFANGQFALNQHWTYGFLLERASSNTYLKRFGFTSPNFLTTQPYLSGDYGRSWAGITGYAFQGLRATDDTKTTPLVLPLAGFNYIYEPQSIGGRVKIGGSALALWRDQGPKQRRVSLNFNWQRPFFTDFGAVITTTASLRTDYYDTSNVFNSNGKNISGQTARALPKGAVEISYPMVRAGKNSRQVIEPIAQLVLSPSLPNSAKTGNEDSQSFIFDSTNLFALDRFTGHDLWDSGSRATVGIRAASYWNSGQTISGLFGQSYAFDNTTVYSPSSGLHTHASDYVGKISFSPVGWIDLEHSFRLDSNDLSYRSADVQASFGTPDYRMIVGYAYTPDNTALTHGNSNQEIYLSGYAHFADHWAIYANTRQAPGGSTATISSGVSLYYIDDCIEIGGTINRDGTTDRNIRPDTSFSLTIRLRNLGS